MQEYNYCGLGRRFLAYIIDSALLLAITFIVIYVEIKTSDTYQNFALSLKDSYLRPLTWGSFFCFIEFMFTLFPITILSLLDSSDRYATPGKYFLNIRVITYDGKKISFLRAFVRTTIMFLNRILITSVLMSRIDTVTLLTALYIALAFDIISSLLIAFTKRKTAFHDIICKTQVIHGNNDGNVIAESSLNLNER